jgi:hypothetical protein
MSTGPYENKLLRLLDWPGFEYSEVAIIMPAINILVPQRQRIT